MRETYGKLLPGMKLSDLAGKLIVIEGTDGAGRTTQINLLRPWLEELGHAVLDTGMTRSALAGEGIRRAKECNNLGRVTQSLFYATDFIDRLENEIAPALRAGFVVLTDRYIYSLMARARVRGVDPDWIQDIYRVALKPDAVFYLRLGIEQLLPRVMFSRGFDYWESGVDLFPGLDMYESFCNYQKALLAEFDRLSVQYGFETIDASSDAKNRFCAIAAAGAHRSGFRVQTRESASLTCQTRRKDGQRRVIVRLRRGKPLPPRTYMNEFALAAISAIDSTGPR